MFGDSVGVNNIRPYLFTLDLQRSGCCVIEWFFSAGV